MHCLLCQLPCKSVIARIAAAAFMLALLIAAMPSAPARDAAAPEQLHAKKKKNLVRDPGRDARRHDCGPRF